MADFNRHFARAIVYGLIKYGGLQCESYRSVQTVEKIKKLLTHVRRDDKLGSLLKIIVEYMQLQSGLLAPILDIPIKWTAWVEHTCLGNLKEGLDSMNGSFVTTFVTPKLQHQYDRSIMEIFSSWGIKKQEMRATNRCRIYLQLIFVLGITTYDGKLLLGDEFEVKRFRSSVLHWSRKVRPPLTDRRVWKNTLGNLTSMATNFCQVLVYVSVHRINFGTL